MNPSVPKALRCLFVGVAPRSRGAQLLSIVLEHCRPLYEPVAFVDATEDLARAEADARQWTDLPCFGDLDNALASVKVDVAVITSPARFHASQIRACLVAGLHVFVAKPMTYDFDQARALVELAESRNLCLLVDQQQRFTKTEVVLAQWVREERFGEVGFVEFVLHRYRPKMRAFTGDDPFIWEQGVHTFNSLIAILDRPAVSVMAFQSSPPWTAYNGPTTVMGVVEFEGGIPCSIFGTFESRTSSMDLRLECRDAAVRLLSTPDHLRALQVALPAQSFEPTGVNDLESTTPSEVDNFVNFHRGCTEGERVPNDGRDNLRTLAVVDAFIRASKSKTREAVRQV